MLTFNEAIKILGSKQQKKIANNTVLSKTNSDTLLMIKLHGYAIIFITKGGAKGLDHSYDMYSLHSCGYKTVTTKRRLNKYGPVSVYQKDFIWYTEHGKFVDGQMFKANGDLIGNVYDSVSK